MAVMPAIACDDRLSARQATAREITGWDNLVERFVNHRVTHKRCWMRSLEKSVGGRPLFLVFERGAEIVACLPGMLTCIGPLRLFGSPLPGWQTAAMGPVFDPSRVGSGELMEAAVGLLEREYGVHHIELISAHVDHAAMHALGFRPEPSPTFRGPLYPGDEQRTFRQLKESARRNVRRGVKLGLVSTFEHDERFVDEAYDQITEVFARGGNAVPFGKKRALEFFRQLKESDSLLAVSVFLPGGSICIATGMFSIAAGELSLWQWAHRTSHRWYRPTELMTWRAMQQAMVAGCTTFDLMGLGPFKEKFGASIDHVPHRWMRSRYQVLAHLRQLAERSYRWQQAFRGRLAQRRLSVADHEHDEHQGA